MSTPNAEVTDLLFRHGFTAGVRFEVLDKPDLVAAVAETTRNGRSVRAIGSNWALSDAGVADDVINTHALRMFLSQPWPRPESPLDPTRIRGEGSEFLETACARDPQAVGRHFVHVEAGIKIYELLSDLAGCGLALPTMGDAGGQSLLGALSTATHGGDFQIPPLLEWVRAVHLIGPMGQEWWITRQGSVFADSQLLRAFPDWCPDTRVLADDAVFDAVRVGVGRMGVIYSVILEVIPNYTLVQVTLEERWSDVRAQLAASSVVGGVPSGIFETPLADLDSGWFRAEIIRRVMLLRTMDITQPVYMSGPPLGDVPFFYFMTHPEAYLDLLRTELNLNDLADDLRGGPAMPLRHLNIIISLSQPFRCWIRRRWSRTGPVRDFAMAPGADDPVIAAVKANKTNPRKITEPIGERLLDKLSAYEYELGWVTHDPRWERLIWYVEDENDRIADEHARRGFTSGEALFYILHEIATDPILGVSGDVAATVSGVVGQQSGKFVQAGPASGIPFANVLDQHDYAQDGAQSGDSVEFHFDAASDAYLKFIDDVVTQTGVPYNFPVFGYTGIRFTPGATALIAMQQFPLTASVEIATARTRMQDIYSSFWHDVHNLARVHGGIPHWGQEFRQSADDLNKYYGDRLRNWRRALGLLADGKPGVFSTAFSRDKGLEPDAQIEWPDLSYLVPLLLS